MFQPVTTILSSCHHITPTVPSITKMDKKSHRLLPQEADHIYPIPDPSIFTVSAIYNNRVQHRGATMKPQAEIS
jgi:hypothetical protein